MTLKLDRADRRLLKRLRKVRLRVALKLRDPAGQTRTVRSTLALRAPKAKANAKRKRG